MALHEITIHENTGASSELAPYLGSYAAKDTVRLDGFAEAVARQCGLPAIQAMAILTGSFDAMEELERDGLVRIHTDLGVVCSVIAGSFPTADAEFDPERNALCLALYLDDAVRLSLANVVPTIVLDGDVTRVRVDNVADIAQPKPYNVIHGQRTFRVAGHKLILSDEGASAYLTDAQGTVYPLVIDQVESDQLFRAHTAALLEPGDYKLVVASRGGEPDGDLQRPFRRVKYLRVVDPAPPAPTITGAKTRGESEGSVNIAGGILDVVGVNLETATAVELHSDTQPTGEASLWQTMPATYADGKLTTGELDFDEKPSDGGFVRVATAGGSALYPITYCAH